MRVRWWGCSRWTWCPWVFPPPQGCQTPQWAWTWHALHGVRAVSGQQQRAVGVCTNVVQWPIAVPYPMSLSAYHSHQGAGKKGARRGGTWCTEPSTVVINRERQLWIIIIIYIKKEKKTKNKLWYQVIRTSTTHIPYQPAPYLTPRSDVVMTSRQRNICIDPGDQSEMVYLTMMTSAGTRTRSQRWKWVMWGVEDPA